MKKIAYGKIGRVFDVDWDKWGVVGGDHEPAFLLLQLADRNPDVEWVVVGKNKGWEPPRKNITNMWQHWSKELRFPRDATNNEKITKFDAVTFPTFQELDGVLMWIGQHGTSNAPIPMVEDRSAYTSPQQSFINYSAFILRGINAWRKPDPIAREEVWLLSDVRNYIKCRDLKWPRRHPILSQFDFAHAQWCERYGDMRSPKECGFDSGEVADDHAGMWRTIDRYVASGLELTPVLDPHNEHFSLPSFHDRQYGFGVVANEARNYGMKPELTRVHTMGEYAIPLNPDWFHGVWTPESQTKLGREIKPTPYGDFYSLLEQTKITITTPTSGSGWPTPKAWEAFRSGTVCFFHPEYDTQGHILPNSPGHTGYADDIQWLASWLRVSSPEDFWTKANVVMTNPEVFSWLQRVQYEYFLREKKQQRCITTIEERLGL